MEKKKRFGPEKLLAQIILKSKKYLSQKKISQEKCVPQKLRPPENLFEKAILYMAPEWRGRGVKPQRKKLYTINDSSRFYQAQHQLQI